MTRKQQVLSIIQFIGSLNREFNVKGSYPFKEYALGNSHMEILFLLSRREYSIKQLSERLHVTSGAVSQFIEFLEAKHLVVKSENPKDKRGRLIALTESSIATVKEFENEYIQNMAVNFKGLSDKDVAQLHGILIKLQGI